jgi:hypothetical protein
MSKVVQWKRGTVTVNDTYTGANGEITVDTTNWNLRVHDGVTTGGYVIDSSQGGSSFTNLTVTDTSNLANVSINETNVRIGTSTYPNSVIINDSYPFGARIGLVSITSNTISGVTGTNLTLLSGNVTSDSFYANASYYANTTSQGGYLFDDGSGTQTGLVNYNENGYTVVGINHDDNQIAKFYDTNTTVLVGNLEIRQDVNVAQSLSNVFLQITGNVDSYLQQSIQNLSTGNTASSDIVATADNGNDSAYYIDMGIDGSNYNDSAFFGDVSTKNDGYLYVVGYEAAGPSLGNVGNLILGSTNGLVKTFVGNIAQANVVTTASESGFTVNKGAFVVAANSAPAAANSTGTTGTIAWDGDYVYVCVATDTWKRANLSTW